MSAPLFHRNNKINERSFERGSLDQKSMNKFPDASPDCEFRWEDDGGAVPSQKISSRAPGKTQQSLKKALTWLQYASKKAPQTRVLPDFNQAMRAMRHGSLLTIGAGKRRKAA